MKRFFLVCFLIASFQLSNAQSFSGIAIDAIGCTSSDCHTSQKIKATAFDSINMLLYVGGKFNRVGDSTRSNLACINISSGKTTSLDYYIAGEVLALDLLGDTLIIGGRFSQVNGIPTPNLAAIDLKTNSVLKGWSPSPNGDVTSIVHSSDRLFVCGDFDKVGGTSRNYFASFHKLSLFLDPWTPLNNGNSYCERLQLKNDSLYFVTDDTLGLPSISVTQYGSVGYEPILHTFFGEISDYTIVKGKVYCVGDFTDLVKGNLLIRRNNVAGVEVSTKNILNWEPRLNIANSFQDAWIAARSDSIYIALRGSSTQNDTDYNYLACFHGTDTGALSHRVNSYQRNLINPHDYYSVGFSIQGDYLFEYEEYASHGNLVDNKIHIHCFQPRTSPMYLSFDSIVCPGDTIQYILEGQTRWDSLVWDFKGDGASAKANANTLEVVFSDSAKDGSIGFAGTNLCGQLSPFRRVKYVVSKVPEFTIEGDTTLNCLITEVQLEAKHASYSVRYNWSSTVQKIDSAKSTKVSIPGMIYLEVEDRSTGCFSLDSTLVQIDTIPPVLSPLESDTINCHSPAIQLNVKSLQPSDSLFWLSSSGRLANPLTVSSGGHYYYSALDTSNGCLDSDSVYVEENFAAPNGSIVVSDSTLSCRVKSVQFSVQGSTSFDSLLWVNSVGDTLIQTNLFADTSGWYSAILIDTISKCSSIERYYLSSDTRSPSASIKQDGAKLTCMKSTYNLKVSSHSPNTIQQWTDSTFFDIGNDVISNPGWYFLLVTDTLNGCSNQDSIFVDYENSFGLDIEGDKHVCFGDTATLWGMPSGAIGPINYYWNGATISLDSLQLELDSSTNIFLQATDSLGCWGRDTLYVNAPEEIIDTAYAFGFCDSSNLSTIVVSTKVNSARFSYSLESDTAWSTSNTFDSISPGVYTYYVKGPFGCVENGSIVVTQDHVEPDVNFLARTSSFAGDTIVLVDVSIPRPDTVLWTLPAEVNVLESGYSPLLRSDDSLIFSAIMTAVYGDCQYSKEKQIGFHFFDSTYATSKNDHLIKKLTLFPNPNSGKFSIELEYYKKQNTFISIYDIYGTLYFSETANAVDALSRSLSLTLQQGTYFFKAVGEFDARTIVFIVQ